MKLYIKLISLTVAMGFIFVVGYASGLLIDTSSAWWQQTSEGIGLLPSERAFEWIWAIVYMLFVVMITPTVAERKLRSALPLWIISGILNIAWTAAFFAFHLTVLGFTILLTEIALLSVITDYYIRNTRFLWLAMLPLLGWYLFSALLNLNVII